MNTGILQKCLDELSKETPRLDYVRGMLETLNEIAGAPGASSSPKLAVTGSTPVPAAELPPMPDLNKIRAAATKEMI